MPSALRKTTPRLAARLCEPLLLGRTPSDLSDAELLAVLLGQGKPAAIDVAGRLLDGNTLRRLSPSRAIDLQHHGASARGAAAIVAAYELARRVTCEKLAARSQPERANG